MNTTKTHIIGRKSAVFAALAALSLFAVVGCGDSTTEPPANDLKAELIAEGQTAFTTCAACHGEHGEGESGPALKHSDYFTAERMRPVRIALLGLPNPIDSNPVVVNGVPHENIMPAIAADWTDRKLAAVVTYIRAVLNDSTSANCVAGGVEVDGKPIPDCDIVISPESHTTMITPDEVKALRDSLTAAGLFVAP